MAEDAPPTNKDRRLRILIIADPVIPVPPVGYGGAERIAYMLARGLHHGGHEVKVMAGPGSAGDWPIFVHQAPDNRSFLSRAFRKTLFQLTSSACAAAVDVVVSFSRPDYLWTLFRLHKPILQIFSNPVGDRDLAIVPRPGANLRLVSVSDAQRRHCPRPDWTTIPNSVPVGEFAFKAAEGSYLAFLGRFHPNKGAHLAIRVALAMGLPLKLAGNIPNDDFCREYFATQIEPHLCGTVEWIGEVDHDGKVDLLSSAMALLFPIEWDEPFGIVMVESLACGTPVIALRRGSVPEVLQDGVTGFICDDVEGMVSAVARLRQIDRSGCRAECERRFSDRLLVERYLEVADELLKTKRGSPLWPRRN